MNIKLKNKVKQNKGITLIALVITIIVLLILAGVSISMLIGENGLIKMASKAVDESKRASKEEEEALNSYEEKLEYAKREAEAQVWSGKIAENFEEGSGTEMNPYQIKNGEELALLAQKVNAGEQQEGTVYTIVNDINLANIGWTPIGGNQPLPNLDAVIDITNVEKQFKGKIKGNNKIIFNLKIDLEKSAGVGLFGILGEGGEIEGIEIGSGDIKGGQEVAGIVGITRGTIKSCENRANITGVDDENISGTGQFVGGIVGSGYGTIENCINRGNILGKNESTKKGRGKYVGGIVGAGGNDMKIIDCINEGEVITQYQQAGGIIATARGVTIENCKNKGNVLATNPNEWTGDKGKIGWAGGIVGWAVVEEDEAVYDWGVVVKNCSNEGMIQTDDYNAGGIIGKMGIGTVIECDNKGNIQANGLYRSGGIVGVMVEGSIMKCSNEAMVIGNGQQVGGILGKMQAGIVEECSNTGTVIGNAQGARGFTGGIVGWLLGGTVNKTYNIGKIQSGNYLENTIDAAGGIVGVLQDTGIVTNNYSNCEIEGGDVQGGIVGQFINSNTAANISNCYYTTNNENIKGIGSKSTDSTQKVEQVDDAGITQRIEKIESYEEFISWINR